MKLYKYFRIGDENDDMGIKEKYSLYAVTTDKDEAKLFEKSRKKGLFLKKVFKGNKNTCIEYLNRHRSSMLCWNELKTVKFDDGKLKHVDANVLMTDMEFDAIKMTMDEMSPILDADLVSSFIFKDNIKSCLDILGYTSASLLSLDERGVENYSLDYYDIMRYIDDIDIDQLVLYLNMIKDQLNPNGFDKIIKFL